MAAPGEGREAAETHVFALSADDAGERLDVWLTARLPALSRSRIQDLVAQGMVTVDGRTSRSHAKTRPGQAVTVTVPPLRPAEPRPQDLGLDVIYEDRDILVLNKPAGLVVHPAPGHAEGTLVNGLLFHCEDLAGIGGVERPGIVHRLDRDTTGVMVVAKNDAAMAGLVAQFKDGRIRKEYLALVHGHPDRPTGTVATAIGRHPRDRKRMAVVKTGGKPAVTHYEVEEALPQASLLAVRIETGRTHQIRVHMAHLGHPIVGDPVYGNPGRDRRLPVAAGRQMLHAAQLSFEHPSDARPLSFSVPPPPDMLDVLEQLRSATGPAHGR